MESNDRLYELLGKKTQSEASNVVFAQATLYPNFIRIYIPNKPYEKLSDGMESISNTEFRNKNTSLNDYAEDNLERSLRRSRKAIKDYAFCNKFELFATFTFNQDRQNIIHSKTKMANWLRNQRNRKGKFKYLIVPEFHKDKQSLHFHALLQGYNGALKQSVNPYTKKPLIQSGHNVYEIPGYTLGFTNVKKIADSTGSSTKVAFYLQKYITKDMPILFGRNRYWASKNLTKPIIEYNPPKWYEQIESNREYVNDYGKILEFDADSHALVGLMLSERFKP